MRHFFVDASVLTGSLVTIKGSEAHHIQNVLRLKPGDHIKLFDGSGFEYEAVIIKLFANKVDVEIRSKARTASNSEIQIIVAQAFLKEKKMDDLVRSLCELGVAQWIPFFSQRSVARPDQNRLAGRTQRWKRIATEALKQCRRSDALEIIEAISFQDVLDISENCDLKIIFWENESNPISRDVGANRDNPANSVLLMLGPEGGFTDKEIKKAEASGFISAGMGPRILRAETATLAACTLVQYLFGDMGPAIYQKKLDKNLGV